MLCYPISGSSRADTLHLKQGVNQTLFQIAIAAYLFEVPLSHHDYI